MQSGKRENLKCKLQWQQATINFAFQVFPFPVLDCNLFPEAAAITSAQLQHELQALDERINAILPPRYVGCFEDVPSASMGSASLNYDASGRVDWGEIWTSFCHLALAGGPPHRGKLLGPVSADEIATEPDAARKVAEEIARGIGLTTPFGTVPGKMPGWVGVSCDDAEMAGWLERAIVAENVIARRDGATLLVPAGPRFRVEKEIKNVIVSVAKTSHYLVEHVPEGSRPKGMAGKLVEPPLPTEIDAAHDAYQTAIAELAEFAGQLRLETVADQAPGWIGLRCASEEMAIWICRAIIVDDILARREGAVLCLPVSLGSSSSADRALVCNSLNRALRLWTAKP